MLRGAVAKFEINAAGFWAQGANLLNFFKFSQKIKQKWWQINNGPGAVDEKEFRPHLPPLHQLLIWFLAFGFGSTAFLLHHHHYCLNWTVLQTGVIEISSEISRNRESNLIWQNIHTLIRGGMQTTWSKYLLPRAFHFNRFNIEHFPSSCKVGN